MPEAGPQHLAALEEEQRNRFRLGAMFASAASLIWVLQAAVMAWAIDGLTKAEPDRVLPAAIGFVVLALCQAMLEGLGGRITFEAATRVIGKSLDTLTAHMATRSPLAAGRMASGALAALGSEKLEAFMPYLTRYTTARLRLVIVPLSLALAVAWVSWVAALVLLIAGPLIPMFMALVGMAAKDASARQMNEIGSMNGLMLDRLRGLADIRLLDAVDRVTDDFSHAAERLRTQTMAVLRIAFLSSTVLELFSALGVALVAVYVGFALLGILNFGTWGAPLTLGQGLFALMLAPAFFQPLRDFAAAWHDRAAAEAIRDEFDAAITADTLRILGRGASPPPLAGPATIRFERVFSDRAGLFGEEIEIDHGAKIAVVGPSGAGKSTCLAMIAGLLPADGGRIVVAGQSLNDSTADSWRARIAWIGQRPHFIAGSLRANVALAGDPRDVSGIEAALGIAGATDVVARAPRGIDTSLGETGQGVSGGEARRLAIARAAFAGRDVILADEPTADLDRETAAKVTDGLLRLAWCGATLIVATHDMALAARMDRRIILGRTAGDADP